MTTPSEFDDTWAEETTALENLQHSWESPLFFDISEAHHPDSLFADRSSIVKRNVFEELAQPMLVNFRLYFDPVKYKVGVDDANEAGANFLLDELVQSARGQHNELIRRDSRLDKNGMRSWKLTCNSFRQFQSMANQGDPRDVLAFRPSLMMNDRRKGSRGPNGREGPRRKNSNRVFEKESVCKFAITVFEGRQGFYLKITGTKSNVNCGRHDGHQCNSALDGMKTTPMSSMTNQQKARVDKYLKSGMGYSATINAMKENEGVKIQHTHIRFLYQKLICGDEAGDNDGPKPTKEAGEVIRGLLKEKHDFVTLFQHKAGAGTTSEFAPASGNRSQKKIGGPPDLDLLEYLHSKRSREGLADDQPLLLCVLWSTAEERALFEKYPNVVKIDTTFGTNHDGLPLVVLSGKTANNETFTIARGNLPNERAFVFKWLFTQALTALFPLKLLQRVQLIISDGDSQEIVQISAAVSPGGALEFAFRLQCVFHIVDRSWNSKVYYLDSKSMDKSPNRFYEPIRKLVMHWIYSWCTPATETKAEYELSNNLLKNYMSSHFFKDRMGHYYEKVEAWFVAVEATIGLCLFYKRSQVVGFEEYTNSSAESNFNSMKHGYSGVHKKMSLARSNFHLNVQADIRSQKIRDKAVSDLGRTCVWSQIPELTSKLSTYAAGLLETAFNKRFDYRSRCDGEVFQVAPMSDVDDAIYSDFSAPFVPIFRRVRTLRLERDEAGRRVLTCDCFSPDRTLFVCCHQLHVIDKYFDLAGIKYTSLVHPNWWASYAVYAYPGKHRKETPGTRELRRKIEAIGLQYDKVGYRGPSLGDQPIRVAENDECHHFVILPTHERLMNWDTTELKLMCPSAGDNGSSTTILGGTASYSEPFLGMSQTSVLFDGVSSESGWTTDDLMPHFQPSSLPAISYESGTHNPAHANIEDEVKRTRMWQRRYDKLIIETRKQQAAIKTGAFQILNPMFKELVSVLERFPERINDRVKNFEWMIAETEKDITDDLSLNEKEDITDASLNEKDCKKRPGGYIVDSTEKKRSKGHKVDG